MDTTKHVLFKMPTLKRPQYKHKLLEILASPPNMIVEMGTYRRKWIPSELYDKPASSNDKLAWVICVDEHETEERGLEYKFIPVREVRVVKAKTEGENLLLWLETKGYLFCDDYERFKEELTQKISFLPPSEGRFIALDVDVSQMASIHVVDPNQHDATNECWRKITDAFANMAVYSNAIFYRVVGVLENRSYLETCDVLSPDDPTRFYQVRTSETYNLEVYYSLPEKQFDLCPQDLMVSADGWLKIYDECTMKDRVGRLKIPIRAETSDPYPYEHSIGLAIAVQSDQLIGPSVKLPIRFLPERLCRRLRRSLTQVVLMSILAVLFFLGLTLPDMFPGTRAYGVLASTSAVVLIPVLIGWALAKNR